MKLQGFHEFFGFVFMTEMRYEIRPLPDAQGALTFLAILKSVLRPVATGFLNCYGGLKNSHPRFEYADVESNSELMTKITSCKSSPLFKWILGLCLLKSHTYTHWQATDTHRAQNYLP